MDVSARFVPHSARFRSSRVYRELLNSSLFMVQGFSSHATSFPRKDFSRRLLALYRRRHAVPLRRYPRSRCCKPAMITNDILLGRADRVLSFASFFSLLICVRTRILVNVDRRQGYHEKHVEMTKLVRIVES